MLRKVRSSLVASSSGHWLENLGFPTRISDNDEEDYEEEEEEDVGEEYEHGIANQSGGGSSCSVLAIPDFDKENPDRSEPPQRTDSTFMQTGLTACPQSHVIAKSVKSQAKDFKSQHASSCKTTADEVSPSDSGAGSCVIAGSRRTLSSLAINKGSGFTKLVISMPITEEAGPACCSLQPPPPQQPPLQPPRTEDSAELSCTIVDKSKRKEEVELHHLDLLSSLQGHSQVEEQTRQLGNGAALSSANGRRTYTHPTSLQKPRHQRVVQQEACQQQELLQILQQQQQRLCSGLMESAVEPKSSADEMRKEDVGSCAVDGGELQLGDLKLDEVVLRSAKGHRKLKKVSVIGGGGSSKIFKVLSEDHQVYALKEVYMKHLDPIIQNSFLKEVQLLKQLQGRPEIIHLHDYTWDEEEHILYILLDCADMDLHTFIKSGHLRKSVNPVVAMWQLWNEMLQIVKVIHDEGIIHNDLKPENFVCKGRNICLIDFGISARIEAEHTSIERDVRCGTVNYMAPETIEASGEEDRYKVGKPSDIWSLGCILYQMMYKRTPFEHIKNKMKKWYAIVNCSSTIAYPKLPQPYAKLVEIVKKCLTKNPKRRPSVDELISYSAMDNFQFCYHVEFNTKC